MATLTGETETETSISSSSSTTDGPLRLCESGRARRFRAAVGRSGGEKVGTGDRGLRLLTYLAEVVMSGAEDTRRGEGKTDRGLHLLRDENVNRMREMAEGGSLGKEMMDTSEGDS